MYTMITFIVAIFLLIFGYIIYGKFVEKNFKIDENKTTPANALTDGVDFVPMSSNKNSFI